MDACSPSFLPKYPRVLYQNKVALSLLRNLKSTKISSWLIGVSSHINNNNKHLFELIDIAEVMLDVYEQNMNFHARLQGPVVLKEFEQIYLNTSNVTSIVSMPKNKASQLEYRCRGLRKRSNKRCEVYTHNENELCHYHQDQVNMVYEWDQDEKLVTQVEHRGDREEPKEVVAPAQAYNEQEMKAASDDEEDAPRPMYVTSVSRVVKKVKRALNDMSIQQQAPTTLINTPEPSSQTTTLQLTPTPSTQAIPITVTSQPKTMPPPLPPRPSKPPITSISTTTTSPVPQASQAQPVVSTFLPTNTSSSSSSDTTQPTAASSTATTKPVVLKANKDGVVFWPSTNYIVKSLTEPFVVAKNISKDNNIALSDNDIRILKQRGIPYQILNIKFNGVIRAPLVTLAQEASSFKNMTTQAMRDFIASMSDEEYEAYVQKTLDSIECTCTD